MEAGVKTISPLALAFLGDSVFDLHIRRALVEKGIAHPGELHETAKSIVSAKAQANLVSELEKGVSIDGKLFELTEEERDILRRGRNAKPKTTAKHASVRDYHLATGLEALMGFLYLSENEERIEEITKIALSIQENDN